MKIKLLSGIICMVVVSSLVGCKKFVEKGNVNINPNQPSFVTLNTLLPGVENSTAYSQAYVAYTTSMFSQQMAAYTSGPITDDRNQDVRISLGYSSAYTAMTNAKILLDMARAQGSPFYMAIARVLLVTNLMLATDNWGEVPLKEAFQATAILYPGYDSQEDVYTAMHSMLDSAITESAQTNNPAALTPGVDDLIFSGTMLSWRQTAYFLKARLYMHTSKKGGATAAGSALNALANAYTSASKTYQLVFSDRNNSPWYVLVSGRIAGSQVYTIGPAARFVNALSGVTYPGLVDPRIDTLMIRTGTNPIYSGIPNGFGNTTNNTNFTEATYFGRKGAPLLIASYAEQKLMEAEALFLQNGGTASSVGTSAAAYNAYVAGIVASLKYYGYDTLGTATNNAKGKAYFNNTQVKASAATLTMEHIMRERQVMLYLNPEAWTDVRRYDYNASLFRGMALPEQQNAEMGGQFIRRALYPLDEINRNPKAQTALKTMTTKVWWDQ